MTVSAASSGDAGVGTPALGDHRGVTIAPAAQDRTELIEIVHRSHTLGFCRWRVATALGASEHELALIDEQTAAEPGRDHEHLVDVGQLVSGLHGLRAASPS